MATQNVTLVKKPAATLFKTAFPLDRYDVYTSESDSTYPFNTGARQPQSIVLVLELRGSANTWAKATLDTT
jgi:hypothetical protein